MSFSLDTPLALYSIPVIWLTAFVPMNLKYQVINKYIGYNSVQPRSNTKAMTGSPDVPPEKAALAERLEGAHLNGNEVLPVWIAGVLSATYAGLPNRFVNKVAIAYISMRTLYNFAYAYQSKPYHAQLRSALFFSGLGLPFMLIIKSANKLRA